MNIFVLDLDPAESARALCDRHVPKMLLESSQLLCSAHEPGAAPYRRTHYRHPCAIWTRSSRERYEWLLDHAEAIAAEYRLRFGREHASERVVAWCSERAESLDLSSGEGLDHVQVVPEALHGPCPVAAYRAYYRRDKARLARWERGRAAPSWWDASA